jgi:hypothetical protein
MQDDVRHDPLYQTFHANMRRRLTQDPAVAIEVAQYFRENDALADRRRVRRDQLLREYNEIGQKRMEQAQRQTDDEFQTAEKAMNLDFDRQQAILNERYRMRWPLHHQGTTMMQRTSPSGYIPAIQRQPPAVTTSSPPLAAQDSSLQDSPRTPSASVDPRLLEANVHVRPSSASPSAVAREDSSFDDSGVAMCNSPVPCHKDYVCDIHKPFQHTIPG